MPPVDERHVWNEGDPAESRLTLYPRASGIPPRPGDFPGEMRGKRCGVPSHAVGRPDNELLGDDRQELFAESALFPVELRVREAGVNNRSPLSQRGWGDLVVRIGLSLHFIQVARGLTRSEAKASELGLLNLVSAPAVGSELLVRVTSLAPAHFLP